MQEKELKTKVGFLILAGKPLSVMLYSTYIKHRKFRNGTYIFSDVRLT